MSIRVICPHFLISLVFHCFWVIGTLYIFWVLIPYEIHDLQIFSLIPCVAFSLLIVSFDAEGFLILMIHNKFIFSFVALLLVSYARNHWQIQLYEAFPLFSSKDFYIFSSYILIFDPFWVNFCIWYNKVRVQLYSFALGIGFSQHHLLTVLSPIEWSWHSFWTSFDHMCEDLLLGSLMYYTGLSVCLYASTTLLWFCNFVIIFDIIKYKPSDLFFFKSEKVFLIFFFFFFFFGCSVSSLLHLGFL